MKRRLRVTAGFWTDRRDREIQDKYVGSLPASIVLTDRFACRPADEMKPGAGRTGDLVVFAVIRLLVGEPMLHVHAGRRTFEKDRSAHPASNTGRRPIENYGCFLMQCSNDGRVRGEGGH